MTSVQNSEQNIFVSEDENSVGFMITNEDGVVITSGQSTAVNATVDETTDYNFVVSMASTTANPVPGIYTAPILVAYIVE